MGHFSFGTGKYMKEAKSRNLMVRVNAIYYLGEKGAENAVPMLIAFLSREEPREIRLNAIIALGKIKQSDSVDALIQLLQERDEQLRGEVAWALGQIREPKAIVPLAGLLNDSKVRLTAIWAMGNIGDESAVPLLTGLLTHENKFVRYNAAQSLKKIGNIN
jgi:HEAT repeat protein